MAALHSTYKVCQHLGRGNQAPAVRKIRLYTYPPNLPSPGLHLYVAMPDPDAATNRIKPLATSIIILVVVSHGAACKAQV